MTAPALVIATGNTHKIEEMKALLSGFIPGLDQGSVATLADYSADSPVEDGLTFSEKALIKARSLAQATGLPALADDSGISVDALGGAPGVFSARWSGTHGSDHTNMSLLLAQLADVKDSDRGARFVCAAALAFPDGSAIVEEGVVEGHLIREARGTGGFGYDPIFVPDGYTSTTAQMSPEEKNQISHRSRALKALVPHLEEILT